MFQRSSRLHYSPHGCVCSIYNDPWVSTCPVGTYICEYVGLSQTCRWQDGSGVHTSVSDEIFFTGASDFFKHLVQHNIFLTDSILCWEVPNAACQAAPDSSKIIASSTHTHTHHSMVQPFKTPTVIDRYLQG